jgi:hypothetical protein
MTFSPFFLNSLILFLKFCSGVISGSFFGSSGILTSFFGGVIFLGLGRAFLF